VGLEQLSLSSFTKAVRDRHPTQWAKNMDEEEIFSFLELVKSPSHTVGLELQLGIRLQEGKILSPSHTVGSERKKHGDILATNCYTVTIPPNGFRTYLRNE